MRRRLFTIFSAMSRMMQAEFWTRIATAMRPGVDNRIGSEEQRLRKRIRFLLPPIVAIGFIFGFAFMATDFLATNQFRGLLLLCFWELILVVNIVLRRRFQKQLARLLNGCCTNCGYDLRATPARCPECGTVAKSKPVPLKNPVISN